jgi:hypothetical protein
VNDGVWQVPEHRGRRPKIDQDRGIEDVTLLILEWLGEQGVNAMIRVDAERMGVNRPPWTFAVDVRRQRRPLGAGAWC